MLKKVYERLVSLGYAISQIEDDYQASPVDEMMITFICDKVVNTVKGECNTDAVPEELEHRVIDNIVGEFLMSKKNLGQLDIADIDFSDTAKSIAEGDTTVQFADGSSQAEMFDLLLSFLLKPIDYSDYRRIRW